MNPQSSPLIEGLKVPVSAIETGLNEFWRRQAHDSHTALLRTATMTLVLISRDQAMLRFFIRTAPELARHHPGRIIIVGMHCNTNDGAIDAHISAHCHWSPAGDKQLCCEQIVLCCPESETAHLPGTLLPLLLVDLPVILYWPDDLSEAPDWPTLWPHVDRLIIKSPEQFADWSELVRYAHRVRQIPGAERITDMAWLYLTPWRQAAARYFDGPDGKELAQNISHIRVTAHTAAMSSTVGWFLAWLMTQWDWQKIAENDLQFLHDGRLISATVDHVQPLSESVSGLHAIELHTRRGGRVVRLWIRRRSGREFEYGESEKYQHLLAVTQCTDAHLLCGELDFFHDDDSYLRICRKLAPSVDGVGEDKGK